MIWLDRDRSAPAAAARVASTGSGAGRPEPAGTRAQSRLAGRRHKLHSLRMSRFQPPPFRSLRDLVLKELQRDKSVLVWDDDWSFADDLLAGVLESEAYVLDRPAQDYLAHCRAI